MSDEHDRLLQIVPKRPEDYAPWGNVERWKHADQAYPDCSSGCSFAHWLAGPLGMDWCVCTNPKSHRVGLLTFEHQGCQAFEQQPECTGIAATWCPVHGDCKCPAAENGERDLDSEDCPLHCSRSTHGENAEDA